MTKLVWGATGAKEFETGVDRGVLYIPNAAGAYPVGSGYAWNGLTNVTESPSGAESNKQYADNGVYLNLKSLEEFAGTIEAFTYPDQFAQCNGELEAVAGVRLGQQRRKSFGLSYRTLKGNDVSGTDFGYKIHLVYGCDAGPSEKSYGTVNDSPEATGLSWDFTTNPVVVGTLGGVAYKPVSTLVIDSNDVTAAKLQALEDILYGTAGADPRLPLPAEVYALFAAGAPAAVTTQAPTYNATTDIITIPSVTGVEYYVNDVLVPSGAYGPITGNTVVTARPAAGYTFTQTSDNDWSIVFA